MHLALGIVLMTVALGTPALADDAKRPMTVEDLLSVLSVSDPQVSPDGTQVVYVVSEVDREANKSNSALWMVPVAGGEPKRLTSAPGSNSHPRWSPDGKTVAFVSDRGGSAQVWLLPMDGGEARQLTKLPVGVSGPIWSPKGDTIAFTAEVVPGLSPEETAKKDTEKAKDKANVRTFDSLMVRHWTSWDEGKRSHLFVADANDRRGDGPHPRLERERSSRPLRRFGDVRVCARRFGDRLHVGTAEGSPLVDQHRHLDGARPPVARRRTSPTTTTGPTPSRFTPPMESGLPISARNVPGSRPTSGC